MTPACTVTRSDVSSRCEDVAHARQIDVDAVVIAGAEPDADARAHLAGDAHDVAQFRRRARTHQRAPRLRQDVRRADGVHQAIGPEWRFVDLHVTAPSSPGS